MTRASRWLPVREAAATIASNARYPLSGNRALVLSGLVRRETTSLAEAGRVFEHLAQGRIGTIHALLGGEGLDAYCPACDRAYCGDHYLMQAEYDEGFYDCTRGTCPEGHKRLVDD